MSSQPCRKFSLATLTAARALLPMMYTGAELCAQLQITPAILHEWLRAGLPYRRDARGHLWFEGRACAHWIATTRKARSRGGLREGEAYCLHCRQAVPLHQPTVLCLGTRHRILQGQCPQCGARLNRGIGHE